MNVVRAIFFQNQGTFLKILKKDREGLPPRSSYAPDQKPYFQYMNNPSSINLQERELSSLCEKLYSTYSTSFHLHNMQISVTIIQ